MKWLGFDVYLGEMSIWDGVGEMLKIVNGYGILSKIQCVYVRCSYYGNKVVELCIVEVGPLEVQGMYGGVV
jgi:hypothetical protein